MKNHTVKELEVKDLIKNLDLSMVGHNMVVKNGWLPSEVTQACELYKNFLFLKFKYPSEFLPPSEDIDEFWHNHILDTKKYRDDCQKIFGYYLDHDPNFDMSESGILNLNKVFATTQDLHMKEFGVPIFGARYTGFSRLLRRLLIEKGVKNEKVAS